MNGSEHMEELFSSLSKFLALHVKLARAEAVADIKTGFFKLGVFAATVPLFLAAYILLNSALVAFLERFCAKDLSLLIVALLNAVGASAGVFWAKNLVATKREEQKAFEADNQRRTQAALAAHLHQTSEQVYA